MIIGGFEYRKTNSLFNLTSHQRYNNKIYLYAKDTQEEKAKYTGLRHLNDFKAFIEYSNDMGDI